MPEGRCAVQFALPSREPEVHEPLKFADQYVYWATSTCIGPPIRILVHRYVFCCTNTCFVASIRVLVHQYVYCCTNTCFVASIRVLWHQYVYCCTNTCIVAPICVLTCQYVCWSCAGWPRDAAIVRAAPSPRDALQTCGHVWFLPLADFFSVFWDSRRPSTR